MSIVNLEPLCARYGMKIIDEKCESGETIVTKALGVLVENGIYAMSLYLLTCQDNSYGKKVLTKHIAGLWKEKGINLIPGNTPERQNDVMAAVRSMTEDISKLILAKKITEQTLTFARYHAKAKSNKKNKKQEKSNG